MKDRDFSVFICDPFKKSLNIVKIGTEESALASLRSQLKDSVERVFSIETSSTYAEESGIVAYDILIGENSTFTQREGCALFSQAGYENVHFGKTIIVAADSEGDWVSVDPNWIIANSPSIRFLNREQDSEKLDQLLASLKL